MSVVDKVYFEKAVKHISTHGDTDIFPTPIEKFVFYDNTIVVVDLLVEWSQALSSMSKKDAASFIRDRVYFDSIISPSGYTGFRLATQIDQLWNAYFLALVLSIGSDIESRRVAIDKEVVFSYRFDMSVEDHVFDKSIGWKSFQDKSLAHANSAGFGYVVSCDISDFYARVYHHSLENELKRASGDSGVVNQILSILSAWSNGASYGLPVGGDAARLLAESVISPLDSHLLSEGICYCRFVDDFRIFAKSREEAQASWVLLSDHLLKTEGLQLQKYKTVVETAVGFKNRIDSTLSRDKVSEGVSTEAEQEAAFLAIHVYYDPYSANAEEDYETLSSEIQKHDILGLVNRQLNRSRVDQSLFKKLLRVVRFLPVSKQHMLCVSFLRSPEQLYPIFSLVLRVVRDCMARFDDFQKGEIQKEIRDLLEQDSYVLQVPVIRIYALRLLVGDNGHEADRILASSYRESRSASIRRDIILINAVRGNTAWLKTVKIDYQSLGSWEKSAFALASYYMGDEGSHWRKSASSNFTESTKILCSWIQDRLTATDWEMPL